MPQKSWGHTVFNSFHVTDFISALYVVLFVIQEGLLNVYWLKVPDMQN